MKTKETITSTLLILAAAALAPAGAHATSFSVVGNGTIIGESAGVPTSIQYKLAVVNGQESAAAVLDDQPADDLFDAARDAAEHLLDKGFATDREAALAIVELADKLTR